MSSNNSENQSHQSTAGSTSFRILGGKGKCLRLTHLDTAGGSVSDGDVEEDDRPRVACWRVK